MFVNSISHNPIGAQILGVTINNEELFYLSPLNQMISIKTLRGGIPVLFPQFGNLGSLKKHGFARDIKWQLLQNMTSSNGDFLEYESIINNYDLPDWNHHARLSLTATLNKNLFNVSFIVTNIGDSSFSFTGGLHPYFKIKARDAIKIKGVENCQFIDSFPLDSIYDLNGDSMIERLYLTNNEIFFFNGSTDLLIKTKGFQNWMIWNPGVDGAKKVSDLPINDWDQFICIEPIIKDPILLNPNDIFIGEMIVELLN